MSKEICPLCQKRVEVVDCPLGHGMPNTYLCQEGHWLEGKERVYTGVKEWHYTALRELADKQSIKDWTKYLRDVKKDHSDPFDQEWANRLLGIIQKNR